jgi:hypothetical protein
LKTNIIIHHSLTADGQTVSWGAIERYHRETQGWQDIGYHAGIELIGSEYYALYGRAESKFAAACKEGSMNQVGLHVCCVGNYDEFRPPDAMLETLVRRILVPWCDRYNIPIENIQGHRDYAPYKSCPGTLFDLGLLRNLVRTNL